MSKTGESRWTPNWRGESCQNLLVASLMTASVIGGVMVIKPKNGSADPVTGDLPVMKSTDQVKLNLAQAKVNSASANVASAQAQAQASSHALTSAARTAQLAAQHFSAAQSAVKVASQAVQSASANLNNDPSQAIASDQTAASQASQSVARAKLAVNTAQTKYNSASEAVTNQNNLVGRALATVNNLRDPMSVNRSLTSAALSNAQMAVDRDQEAIQRVQMNQRVATSEVASATVNVASAQTKLTSANRAMSMAQAAASEAQMAVNEASAAGDEGQKKPHSATDLPTFNFTNRQQALTQQLVHEWVKHVRVARQNYQPISTTDVTALSSYDAWQNAMTDSSGHDSTHRLAFLGVDWHDQSSADSRMIVNPNALTTSQVKILSEWTAAILNQLSRALGIQQLIGQNVVTVGMVGNAQEVAALTSKNNQSGRGHYVYGLNQAAYDYGLTADRSYLNDYYRDQCFATNGFNESSEETTISQPYDQFTMADAKQKILRAITLMLDDDADSQMGHAIALLGFNSIMTDIYNFNGTGAEGQVIGTSLSGNVNENGGLTVHIITYPALQLAPIQIKDPTLAAKQKVAQMDVVVVNQFENSSSANDQPTQLAIAHAQLTAAQKLAETIVKLKSVQIRQGQAQTAADQATRQLKAAHDHLRTAQQDLKHARQAFTNDQTRLAQAQSEAAKEGTNQSSRAIALQTARDRLAAVKAPLAHLGTVADQAKQTLDRAKDALTSAQLHLRRAQAKLTQDQAISSQPTSPAQSTLTRTKNKLKQAQATLQLRHRELTQAQQVVHHAQTAKDNAQSALQAVRSELAVALATLQKQTKTQQVPYPTSIQPDQGQPKSMVQSNSQSSVPTQPVTQPTVLHQASPQRDNLHAGDGRTAPTMPANTLKATVTQPTTGLPVDNRQASPQGLSNQVDASLTPMQPTGQPGKVQPLGQQRPMQPSASAHHTTTQPGQPAVRTNRRRQSVTTQNRLDNRPIRKAAVDDEMPLSRTAMRRAKLPQSGNRTNHLASLGNVGGTVASILTFFGFDRKRRQDN